METQSDDGIFKRYRAVGKTHEIHASWQLQSSSKHQPPALSDPGKVPGAQEIEAAPRWQISLPQEAFVGVNDLFLEVNYLGDIARLSARGHLLTDNFYNGTPWTVGLKRFQTEAEAGSLQLTVVPWRKGSDVILDSFAKRRLVPDPAQLLGVGVTPEYQLVVP